MDATWFFVLESVGNVSGHSEVWILIDSLWNETVNLLVGSENMWESVGKGWNSLDGWEGNSSTVMTWGQSEDTLTLEELENV